MVLTVLSDPLRYMYEQVKLANVFEILLGKRTGTNNTVYCTLQDPFFIGAYMHYIRELLY